MKLHVGVPELRGKSARFPFEFFELSVRPGMMGPKLLRGLVAERPELVFCLRAPLDMVAQPGAENLEPLAETLRAVQPAGLILPTGPRFGPSRENQRALARVAEAGRKVARFVAWEPHGVFEVEEAARWAGDAGVVLVSDWTREAAVTGGIGYTRLRALGRSGGISQHHVDRLLELLPDFEEAFILVEGDGALRLKNELSAALAAGLAGSGFGGADDDFEDDAGDELEDDADPDDDDFDDGDDSDGDDSDADDLEEDEED